MLLKDHPKNPFKGTPFKNHLRISKALKTTLDTALVERSLEIRRPAHRYCQVDGILTVVDAYTRLGWHPVSKTF